jgi:hypothetical protein
VRQDYYHRSYLPAMRFLRAQYHPGQLIMGSEALGFDLGYDGHLLADNTLGLRTGRVPDWIVVEEHFQMAFDFMRKLEPPTYSHIQSVLARFEKVYDQGGFQVYKRPS